MAPISHPTISAARLLPSSGTGFAHGLGMTKPSSHITAAVVLAGALCAATRAEARPSRFLGAHPVSAKMGGGFCYIEAPHIHAYAPDRTALYQQVGDDWVFTSDPTPFGYEGERHTYYGAHPVAAPTGETVYCFLDGPHYHPFAPPSTPDYKIQGGVAFYVGAFPPPAVKIRAQRYRPIQAEYRPYASLRPVVQVQPPPEWRPEIVVAAPEPPQVVVNAPAPPSVQVVTPPPPRVHVVAPAPPSVQVVAPPPPRVQVVAPAPPSVTFMAPAPPSVVVSAPRPHVGVVVGAPPPPSVYVGGSVTVVKGHHDHGKHKGWYK
jgi:hypothetical protein